MHSPPPTLSISLSLSLYLASFAQQSFHLDVIISATEGCIFVPVCVCVCLSVSVINYRITNGTVSVFVVYDHHQHSSLNFDFEPYFEAYTSKKNLIKIVKYTETL